MVAVPFPRSSAPGRLAESGGRLINASVEMLSDGRTKISGAAGIRAIIETTAHSHCRGMIEINGVVLAALDDRLYTLTRSGGAYIIRDIGAFAGSKTVYFARNNKAPTPDIVAVTDSTAFVISMTTGASSYPDADIGSPNSVTSFDGYFCFSYGNARMRTTGLNDTAINTLDTAFAESKPDGLLRVISIGRYLFAFGSQTIEAWQNNGNPVGFPFSKLETIPRGLASADAVAGHESEWSNTIVFAGNDNVVYRINGLVAEPVSTPSVQKALERLDDMSTLRAMVYAHEGHAVWALSAPDWTWCCDMTTGSWVERASYGSSRWRACASVKCFGKWVVGDADTGKFGVIDPDHHLEFGDPLVTRVVSATMSGFPVRAFPSRLVLDIMAGVGEADGPDPIATNPHCAIAWSRDGGVSFGSPVRREIGRQGHYARVVSVNRLGMASAKGIQIAVEISDPVAFSLFGGELSVQPGAS